MDLNKVSITDILDNKIQGVSEEQPEVITEGAEETITEQVEPTETTTETAEPNQVVESQEDKSVIETLKQHFGYELENQYTDDFEGLKGFTAEVAKKMALSELDELFKTIPDVGQYMQYRMNGGDPQKFFKVNYEEPDFSTFQVTEDSTDTNKEVLRYFLADQGFTNDEIIETLKDYEDTGILHKQAAKALPKLVKLQQTEKEMLQEKRRQEVEQEALRRQQEWTDIKQTISKGALGNIMIPEAEKDKFFSWMATPVQDGKSQRMIDREKLSIDKMLALEYLLYKGLDVSKLAVMKSTTAETEKLRDLLKTKNTSLKGSGIQQKTQNKVIRIQDFLQ